MAKANGSTPKRLEAGYGDTRKNSCTVPPGQMPLRLEVHVLKQSARVPLQGRGPCVQETRLATQGLKSAPNFMLY